MKRAMPVAGALLIASGCAGPRPFPFESGGQRIAPAVIQTATREQAADMASAVASIATRNRGGPLDVLVLSSGGQGGAFGAGFVEGWGASGARPEFDLVTGVSTGALIAVFAFLGDDRTLCDMYTTHATSDVYTPYPWVSILSSSAYAASTPLRSAITRYITADVVESIAYEAAKGRVLLISTSNLDLNTLRVWNMTALAGDQTRSLADRVSRFREILIASLSIPGLVPPVFLDGCMHADGGILRQIFIADDESLGEVARALRDERSAGPAVWVVLNRRSEAAPRVVRNQIIPIAARSVQMMIDSTLRRDLDDVRRFAHGNGGAFRCACLPIDPDRPRPDGFLDPVYMKEIHALGRALGRRPDSWSSR